MSAQFASTENGAFGTAKTITASTDLTQVTVQVPITMGEAVRGNVFRLKLSGTGRVTIHDALIRYMQGRV